MPRRDLPAAQTALPTTAALLRDLAKIDRLIAALHIDIEPDDLDDLRWLRQCRREIAAAVAWRRAQKGRKIVSLAAWCRGGIAAAEPRYRAA